MSREHEALVSLRYRLDKPEAWTTRALARDKSGAPCKPATRAGVAWSVYGAIGWRFDPDRSLPTMVERGRVIGRLLEAVYRGHAKNGYEELTRWNDTLGRTHAEVIAMLDKAIRECERSGS